VSSRRFFQHPTVEAKQALALRYDKKPTDPWSGDHLGFFNTLGAVARTGPNKGKRSYAARGYFEANAQRPNLHLLCDALVTNVELNGGRAVGVNFTHEGRTHNVKAAKEIIVSCGALQTPQILELSGIGDPDVLKAAGVECKVVNKGVGANFQDHALTAVVWELKPGNPTLDAIHDPQVMQAAQQQYMESQTGPMTSISSMQGFFPYKLFATEAEQKEIIKSVEDSMANLSPFQKKQYERTLEHLKSNKSANLQLVLVGATPDMVNGPSDQSRLFTPPIAPDRHQMLAAMCLQYPLSRGTVHIKSADPTQLPAIDPAFLSHPADVAVLAAGVQMLAKAEQTSHLKDKIQKRVAPGPEVDVTDSEKARDWVRDWVLSEYHPCGSCAMGDALDSRLRVKGVQGLRVVDASIFPNHVSGNIVSSVYMSAEKGADLIKEDNDYAALGTKR